VEMELIFLKECFMMIKKVKNTFNYNYYGQVILNNNKYKILMLLKKKEIIYVGIMKYKIIKVVIYQLNLLCNIKLHNLEMHIKNSK
jgi:hypothetical protein